MVELKITGHPVKYSRSKPSILRVPPSLGEHTTEILTDILGLTEMDVSNLYKDKVVA